MELRSISAVSLGCLLVWGSAQATPGTLRYEGTLRLGGGAPVDDRLPMVFRIHDAAEGGSVLWPAGEAAPVMVAVEGGRFAVDLGPLSPALFDAPTAR